MTKSDKQTNSKNESSSKLSPGLADAIMWVINLIILTLILYHGKLLVGLHFLMNQLQTIYEVNPLATISMISSFLAIMFLYYGTLLRSENRYTTLAEKIETYLKGIGFLTIIPTTLFIAYLFIIEDIMLVFAAFLLMVYQLYCASIKIASELKNRYDYNQLYPAKVLPGLEPGEEVSK